MFMCQLYLVEFSLQLAEPLLPYALAFAAGAMVFVVVDDIVPEAHSWLVLTCDAVVTDATYVCDVLVSSGNGRLSSLGVIIGFIVMMSLDVGLG